jgi:hypothetical protein
MSVDLDIDPVRPTPFRPLLPRIAAVLSELLGGATLPSLVLERLEHGERLAVADDHIGAVDAPFLLLSLAGEPETIGIQSAVDRLSVTVYGARSDVQYALGAATAIVLAQALGSVITDDRQFFSDHLQTSPEALLDRLRVAERHQDHREAAGRIAWGPGGQPRP